MKQSHILLGAAALALGATMTWAAPLPPEPITAQAQTQAAPSHRRRAMSPATMAKRMTTRLDREVKLTPDQKTKVEAIYEKAFTDMASARQSSEGREAMRKIHTQATNDVKALLTPEQLAKFPAPRGRRGPQAQ